MIMIFLPMITYTTQLHSNAFIKFTTKPTRKTPTSQITIDHIVTNDSKSKITPGVLIYSPITTLIFCKFLLP